VTQAQALLLSLVIEVPVVWLAAGRDRRAAVMGAAATLLTHPLVFTLTANQGPEAWLHRVAIAEVGAAVAEAALFWWFLALPPARAAGVSTVANAASFGVGLLWWQLR
jgi:hypothetical protein